MEEKYYIVLNLISEQVEFGCKDLAIVDRWCSANLLPNVKVNEHYSIVEIVIPNEDDSNRLDGVVIQKPAGGISREEFVKTILDIRSMTSAKGDSKLWKKINNLWEDVQVIGLIENGEGYAQGIGQTLEATKRTEKMLLDECCEALGWQGGTIHQVKDKIKEMVEENKCLPFARDAFIDIHEVDKLDDIKFQIEIIIRELENILHIPPDSRFSV